MTIEEYIAKLRLKKRRYNNSRAMRKAIAKRLQSLISQGFSSAIVDGDAVSDVDVTVSDDGTITTVLVTGKDVIFVEFGAGVFFNGSVGSSPHPKGHEFGFTIGSYGKGKGGRETWAYYTDGKVQWTHGTKATMPVFKACEIIKLELPKIIKEVLQND
jgi:hypothetical protein|nr:MAG TPA: hypothetical protein [Caudoviricetes sp.]